MVNCKNCNIKMDWNPQKFTKFGQYGYYKCPKCGKRKRKGI